MHLVPKVYYLNNPLNVEEICTYKFIIYIFIIYDIIYNINFITNIYCIIFFRKYIYWIENIKNIKII